MGPGHEKLDVYRLSIGYVAWVYGSCEDDLDFDSDTDPDSDPDLDVKRRTSRPEGAGDSR
jgi:hypothetical protein